MEFNFHKINNIFNARIFFIFSNRNTIYIEWSIFCPIIFRFSIGKNIFSIGLLFVAISVYGDTTSNSFLKIELAHNYFNFRHPLCTKWYHSDDPFWRREIFFCYVDFFKKIVFGERKLIKISGDKIDILIPLHEGSYKATIHFLTEIAYRKRFGVHKMKKYTILNVPHGIGTDYDKYYNFVSDGHDVIYAISCCIASVFNSRIALNGFYDHERYPACKIIG